MLFGNEKNKDLLINFLNKALPGKNFIHLQYLQNEFESIESEFIIHKKDKHC